MKFLQKPDRILTEPCLTGRFLIDICQVFLTAWLASCWITQGFQGPQLQDSPPGRLPQGWNSIPLHGELWNFGVLFQIRMFPLSQFYSLSFHVCFSQICLARILTNANYKPEQSLKAILKMFIECEILSMLVTYITPPTREQKQYHVTYRINHLK